MASKSSDASDVEKFLRQRPHKAQIHKILFIAPLGGDEYNLKWVQYSDKAVKANEKGSKTRGPWTYDLERGLVAEKKKTIEEFAKKFDVKKFEEGELEPSQPAVRSNVPRVRRPLTKEQKEKRKEKKEKKGELTDAEKAERFKSNFMKAYRKNKDGDRSVTGDAGKSDKTTYYLNVHTNKPVSGGAHARYMYATAGDVRLASSRRIKQDNVDFTRPSKEVEDDIRWAAEQLKANKINDTTDYELQGEPARKTTRKKTKTSKKSKKTKRAASKTVSPRNRLPGAWSRFKEMEGLGDTVFLNVNPIREKEGGVFRKLETIDAKRYLYDSSGVAITRTDDDKEDRRVLLQAKKLLELGDALDIVAVAPKSARSSSKTGKTGKTAKSKKGEE